MRRLNVYDNGGKTADRYTVVLNDDQWLLSHDANMPNGVCMYGGKPSAESIARSGRKITLGDLPKGALLAVISIFEEELSNVRS